MKQIKTLKPGTKFAYAGTRFVVLEQMSNGTFCLEAQSHTVTQFASADMPVVNNYATSVLREEMEQTWFPKLLNNGAKPADFVDFTLDLLASVGQGYGALTVKAAPLTVSQYRKYATIVPPDNGFPWWLATPYKATDGTDASYGTTSAFGVFVRDDIIYDTVSNTFGSRAAVKLVPELQVTVISEPQPKPCDTSAKLIDLVDDLFMGESDNAAELLGDVLMDEIQSDSVCLSDVARDLWRVYTQNPAAVDDVLAALCGWNMKSLLKRTGIILEDSGELVLSEAFAEE